MGCLGNLLWFVFGGFIGGVLWMGAGCLWCLTIIGIPIGLQCFKLANVAFFPFEKMIEYGGGGINTIANVFWLIFSGLELAIYYLVLGCLACMTIIGIPFGMQFFKLAKLSLMPFGTRIY